MHRRARKPWPGCHSSSAPPLPRSPTEDPCLFGSDPSDPWLPYYEAAYAKSPGACLPRHARVSRVAGDSSGRTRYGRCAVDPELNHDSIRKSNYSNSET